MFLFVPQENNKEKKDFIRGQERQKSRKKKGPRRLDKKMQEQLEASGCPLLGVVLNKVKISENKSYGGYGQYPEDS